MSAMLTIGRRITNSYRNWLLGGLVDGVNHVQCDLGLLVEALPLGMLLGVVRVDLDLLATEVHCGI